MRDRQDAQRRDAVVIDRGLGSRAHEVGRSVGASVVDHEDFEPLRKMPRAGCTVAGGLATSPEIAEQLVESGPNPLGLVVCRQDERQ
jgi:hypothetical protein